MIDFYFACTDFFAYDLAICLNAWCFESDGSFNVTKARALLAQYRAGRPLDAAEIADLPVLARGSALRFLLTRLYDRLNHTAGALVRPKDPLEYLQKLRFPPRRHRCEGLWLLRTSGGTVDIFTDGACSGNPGPGGWGAMLRWTATRRNCPASRNPTTNNRMEMMAAIAALEALEARHARRDPHRQPISA